MRKGRFAVAAAVISIFITQSIFAGAPLKGVGVSMGKSPGGTPVKRVTTGADGTANFGVVPKGEYMLAVLMPPTREIVVAKTAPMATANGVVIIVDGVVGGRITRELSDPNADLDRAAPITFTTDGRTPVIVTVTAK